MMRPKRTLRDTRTARMAAGAFMLATPPAAAALAAAQADAQSALQIDVRSRQVTYGDKVRVTGTGPASTAAEIVELEYAPSGSAVWRSLGSTRIGREGHFRLDARVPRSGLLRAVAASTMGGVVATRAAAGSANALAGVPGSAAVSAATPVSVEPRFALRRRAIGVLSGGPIHVRGRLLPGVGGRRVTLQAHAGGGWRTIASDRTAAGGRFTLTSRAFGRSSADGRRLRVAFRGDAQNTAAATAVGRFIVFQPTLASWYYDGGSTACGFHAALGVANKVLPCGTRVTFRYGSNMVTAVVDDRGPYVGGREWDLNQNTAAALGFGGVGTVWATS